jgi:hypothetical protein
VVTTDCVSLTGEDVQHIQQDYEHWKGQVRDLHKQVSFPPGYVTTEGDDGGLRPLVSCHYGGAL